jgi:hypothetical protein
MKPLLLTLLLACGGESPPAAAPAPLVREPLDPPRLLRRMSLDLRGALPSIDELDAVEADPSQLGALRDAMLDDPRFEERMVVLYQERWRTQTDEYRGMYYDFGLEMIDEYESLRAIGGEPLRLAARVVASDRPYSDILTVDWTMANPLLASLFPIDYPDGATGWQEARYTDGRPAAGVLSTNGLWWRYVSPIFNYNRARTAAILDLFVCQDILTRPVLLDTALAPTAAGAEEAIRSQDVCLSCHATVEPISATLFGFLPEDDFSALEMTRYHPERERAGESTLGVQAAWYGQPVDGLAGLGQAIARDGRFVDCAVETAAQGLLRRDVAAEDGPLLREAREAMVQSDLSMKAALRAITDSPIYQVGALSGGVTAADAARESTARILVATQLRSVYADLSGYSWRRFGADLLDSDSGGYRVMANGVDGESLSDPLQAPGLTWALVAGRVAQTAARDIALHDLAAPAGEAFLLDQVDAGSTPADPAFREQIAALHWRLLAERPSEATIDALAALWNEAYGLSNNPTEAWATVLSALLRDPAFLAY